MKKLILTSLLTLALAASASAAVPSGGVYLDKDGTPLTEAQQVPPSLRSHKMAPQNAAIQEATNCHDDTLDVNFNTFGDLKGDIFQNIKHPVTERWTLIR